MTMFFFNLHERGSVLIDEEGKDMPDADAAYANALREARQLMSAEVLSGRLCLGSHIDVVDDKWKLLFAVSFKDAIDFSKD